ncbi:MAG: hypothetical protein E6H61_04085 [Betaproteobacteria bacterium]|nr:MAG: hypothetical protein E6H61_04085 [Betaproteobacteria bacterium]
MLREVLIVEQDNPALKRRWFESDYFDLFIWQDAGGAFVRFQLCYDVELNERALVWSDTEGFYHDGVDHGGSMDGGVGEAPILVRDGKFDSGTVVPRFEREAAEIPADVRDFVLAENGPQARAARALAAAQTPVQGVSKELTTTPG